MKKYNFSVIECEDDEDWFLIDSLFKIIKVNPTSIAKKEKDIGLYFKEDTALIFKNYRYLYILKSCLSIVESMILW